MNILFVSGHPAQVHNFRLVREDLIRDGHKVFWLTTNKDIATNLLDIYGIPYELYHKPKKKLTSQLLALVRNTWCAARFILSNDIDIAVSRTDPYSTLACFLLRRKHIVIDDTEHAAVGIRQRPFALMASCILVPDCFWYKISKAQMCFPGNIELFYCRPGRFVLNEPWSLLGFEPGTRYAIVRFVKWDAYHDVSLIGGYTSEDKIRLVRSLLEVGLKVLITSEAELPEALEPYRVRVPIERMHDVMACAQLFIGESSSMASECVVLGTPAIYVDQVGRGYTDEEAREELLYMYRPVPTADDVPAGDKDFILGGRKESMEKAIEIASPEFDREGWNERHSRWMATKFDCTGWLTWFIENYPESEKEWRENRVEIEKRFRCIQKEIPCLEVDS